MVNTENLACIQEWIPINNFDGDTVLMKNGKGIKIIEVKPINFELKSDFEQEAVLESYKRFLKSCNFNIQISIQTQVTDISKYLRKIKKFRNENDVLKEMSDDYINFIEKIISSKKSVSRKFYIIIEGDSNLEENICKIKEGLESCGNTVRVCNYDENILMMKNYFNRRIRGLERNNI